MVQLEETVWRFLHAPLLPGTDYRVTLSNRLADEFNAPLQHAPVTFVFTVAP